MSKIFLSFFTLCLNVPLLAVKEIILLPVMSEIMHDIAYEPVSLTSPALPRIDAGPSAELLDSLCKLRASSFSQTLLGEEFSTAAYARHLADAILAPNSRATDDQRAAAQTIAQELCNKSN